MKLNINNLWKILWVGYGKCFNCFSLFTKLIMMISLLKYLILC